MKVTKEGLKAFLRRASDVAWNAMKFTFGTVMAWTTMIAILLNTDIRIEVSMLAADLLIPVMVFSVVYGVMRQAFTFTRSSEEVVE